MYLFILIAASYLIGSIPTSIIAGKALRGIDIREHGSRNPGATNTFRVLGWKIGVAVGLFDIFKGFFAVWFLASWIPDTGLVAPDIHLIVAGISAVLGHTFTVFAGFKGGKGVGTAFGVFLGLAPAPSIIAFAVWAALVWRTGYVSVGSIAGAVVLLLALITQGMIAGNLTPGFHTETYNTPGEANGVHWETANTDSGTFIWTAPDPGVGEVRLYWAGLQGSRVYGADLQFVEVSEDLTADVEFTPGWPSDFSMGQNYPNPFNDRTTIEFSIAKASPIEFIITNILGQVLYYWRDDYARPGTVLIHWNGFDLNAREQPSGVYFYRLKTPEITMTNKMMILR